MFSSWWGLLGESTQQQRFRCFRNISWKRSVVNMTFKRRSWDIYIQSNISWTSPWYFIFHLDFTKVVNPTSVGMSALQQRCKLTHRHLYRKTWCYGNLSFIFVTCCLSMPEYSLANFEVLFSKPPVRIITESEIYPQNTIRPVAVWDWKSRLSKQPELSNGELLPGWNGVAYGICHQTSGLPYLDWTVIAPARRRNKGLRAPALSGYQLGGPGSRKAPDKEQTGRGGGACGKVAIPGGVRPTGQ